MSKYSDWDHLVYHDVRGGLRQLLSNTSMLATFT